MSRDRETRATANGLLWLIERIDGRDVRRTLIDLTTGEVLDQCWRDEHGRTRSWSAKRERAFDAPRTTALSSRPSTASPGGAETPRGAA